MLAKLYVDALSFKDAYAAKGPMAPVERRVSYWLQKCENTP